MGAFYGAENVLNITCALDAALEPDGEGVKTRIMERPAFGECVRGNLAEIPPFAVLQMLEMGRKAGLLEVDGGEIGPARMWLVDGGPVHAETKTQRGFDAAIAIVNAAAGQFSFEPGRAAPEHTIEASTTARPALSIRISPGTPSVSIVCRSRPRICAALTNGHSARITRPAP